MIRTLIKYRWEAPLLLIGIVLTAIARDYAVSRRLSMGLDPSWGGEFFIIPIMLLFYAVSKADWSIEE